MMRARAISPSISSRVMSMSSRHHAACCDIDGSGRTFPVRMYSAICVMRYGFPTPPLAIMTPSAEVVSMASTASLRE